MQGLTQAFMEETQGKPAPIREFEVTSVMAMLHPIEKADLDNDVICKIIKMPSP